MGTGRIHGMRGLWIVCLLVGCISWCFVACTNTGVPESGRGSCSLQDEADPSGSLSYGLDEEATSFGGLTHADGEVVRSPAFLPLGEGPVAGRQSAWGSSATWKVEGDVPSTASLLLEEYRGLGSLRLAYDGYLDFFQRVWGCVVVGATGEVEVALVDGREGDDGFEESEGSEACTLTLLWLGPR